MFSNFINTFLVLMLLHSVALGQVLINTNTNNKETTLKNPKDSIVEIIDTLQNQSQGFYHETNKDYKRITVVLPLMLDKTKAVYNANIDDKVKNSVFVWEGIRLALDSLNSLGFYADVQVIDQGESNNMDSLFSLPQLQNAEIVIGPLYNQSIRNACPIAKALKVPLVSVLSPTPDLAQNNEYFMQINPSFDIIQEAILNDIQLYNGGLPIYILNKDENDENNRALSFSKLAATKTYNGNAMVLKNIKLTDNWSNYFSDTLASSVIIVNSFKESFLKEVSVQLSAYKGHRFIVYGMPNWREIKKIKELFANADVYSFCPNFINKEGYDYGVLKDYFYDKYRLIPNEVNMKSFDVMMMIGTAMQQHPKNYWNELQKANYRGVVSLIKPNKAIDNSGVTKYYENKGVYKLKFEKSDLTWYHIIQ